MTFRYRVEGEVQGVAFRYHTSKEASRLGIKGTVRNLPDGSVEIYASSDPGVLRIFEEFLKGNPGHSSVRKIEKEEVVDESDWEKFIIIY